MNENQAGFPTYGEYSQKSNKRRNIFFILVGFIVLVLIIAAGLFVLGSIREKPKKIAPAPTANPTTTPLPTASVSAVLTGSLTGAIPTGAGRNPTLPGSTISKVDSKTKLDRGGLLIKVLNGSGEKGAAAAVSTYLEGLGYKIAAVGNADVYSYRNLTVQVKKTKSGYAALLKKDLQDNPAFATVSASISDDISTDAEVIVGK